MMIQTFPEAPRFSVDALGIETSYLMLGEGKSAPVILLHGMSTAADSFQETMYGLADQFWLIAPDIPGFGYSANTEPYHFAHLVEWLAALRLALDLAPGPLVGRSFGGALAAAYTLAYPEDVTRLLLAAPPILGNHKYPPLLKRAGISLGLIDVATAVSQSPLWVKRQIKRSFYAPERQDETIWQRRLQDYKLARASASALKATAFLDLSPELPTIRQPVCLVWGENDPMVPAEDAQTLAALLPHAEVHMLPECGHVSILEQPALFQAIAREFLRE